MRIPETRHGRAAAAGLLLTLLYAAGCGKGSPAARSPLPGDSAAARSASESTAAPLTGGFHAGGGADSGATASRSTAARHRILFAGTSLTAGLGLDPDSAYPMLIQRKIDSAGLPFDVTNAGVSGETSSGLLDRLSWLLRGNFDVLVLETGANDGLRGIPPATVQENLESAITRIKAAKPDARILLVQMEALPNLGPQYARAFHEVYPTVARAEHVTLLPFLLAGVAGHRDLNQSDGVHPNYRGEPMVAENVWRGLEPVLRALVQR